MENLQYSTSLFRIAGSKLLYTCHCFSLHVLLFVHFDLFDLTGQVMKNNTLMLKLLCVLCLLSLKPRIKSYKVEGYSETCSVPQLEI